MSTELSWFKSTYSDSSGGECLEVAQGETFTHIRDSKLGPRSPQLAVPVGAWSAFVSYARDARRQPHS